jgi:hypothetical protein
MEVRRKAKVLQENNGEVVFSIRNGDPSTGTCDIKIFRSKTDEQPYNTLVVYKSKELNRRVKSFDFSSIEEAAIAAGYANATYDMMRKALEEKEDK